MESENTPSQDLELELKDNLVQRQTAVFLRVMYLKLTRTLTVSLPMQRKTLPN